MVTAALSILLLSGAALNENRHGGAWPAHSPSCVKRASSILSRSEVPTCDDALRASRIPH